MPQKPTLLQELEQFMYTHAPQALYKKPLFAIVKKWEDAYLDRIDELEKTPPLAAEFNRLVAEGGTPEPMKRICDCAATGYITTCRFCRMTDEEYEAYEMQGSRYGSD